jgi:site-specific DNA-methyltransferase (adenine-specific)
MGRDRRSSTSLGANDLGYQSQADSCVAHKRRAKVFQGDCLKALAAIPSASVDLIVTSPPYTDRRNHTYGGIHPDRYLEWFLPRALVFQRVLKPTGSFVLNIKEQVIKGSRSLYVYDLISTLIRQQEWTWVDDYCWHKKNAAPGKWPNRFRDAWEHCYHLTKAKEPSGFYMNQEEVMVPAGDWQKTRLNKLSAHDKERRNSATGSGIGRKVEAWVGREKAYPSNVLYIAAVSYNTNHSAAFPLALPEFFIKLFTPEDGVVCDPFLGSGTTAIAALQNQRDFVGVELLDENIEVIRNRLAAHKFEIEVINTFMPLKQSHSPGASPTSLAVNN